MPVDDRENRLRRITIAQLSMGISFPVLHRIMWFYHRTDETLPGILTYYYEFIQISLHAALCLPFILTRRNEDLARILAIAIAMEATLFMLYWITHLQADLEAVPGAFQWSDIADLAISMVRMVVYIAIVGVYHRNAKEHLRAG